MNVITGKPLEGIDHFRQSIRDILTTPIGSRVMRRDYGSRIMSIIDAPTNEATLLEIYSAGAEALNRWEPRLLLESIEAKANEAGQLVFGVYGKYLPDGSTVAEEGIIV
jgi:phage baseplate assembly protein W